jgi:ribose transport system substrate-binding protein
MKKNIVSLIVGLVVIVALVVIIVLKKGPRQSEKGGRRPVALIMKTMTNEFFQTMEKGGRDEAKRLGVRLLVQSASRETAIDDQADIVSAMVGSKVEVILIAPADSKGLVRPLLAANRAGIPVINLDNPLDPGEVKAQGLKLVSYIGTDNVKGAEMATRELIRAMGGKGNIAMLEGIKAADNAQKRRQGYLNAVAETKGKVVEMAHESANWETEQAANAFAAMLQARPQIEGLFCANDNMALGAIRAIEAAGKTGKILVAGFDNLKAIQGEVLKGTVHCTIDQHADWMAAEGVKMALKLMRGEEIPESDRVKLVNLELITKEVLQKKRAERGR